MSSNYYPPYDPNQNPYGQPQDPNAYRQNTAYPGPYNPMPPQPPDPNNPYAEPTIATPPPNPYPNPYGPGPVPSNPNNQVLLHGSGPYSNPSYPGMPNAQPVPPPMQPPTLYGGYGPPGSMPPAAPAPQKNRGASPAVRLFVVMIAVVLIIGGIGAYAFLSYQNTQKSNANATATAQGNIATNATSAASARQLTATQTTSNVNATATSASTIANTTATAQAGSTATSVASIPSTNPYPPNTGTLALSASLTTNDGGLPNSNGCSYKTDGYHARAENGFYQVCPNAQSYSNLAVEVQMSVSQGGCGGLILRSDNATSKYYLFEVCSNGNYSVYRYHGNGGNDYDTIKASTPSPAIQIGIGQTNIIAVVANGANLDFYVNHQQVDHEHDTSYVRGVTGLVSDGSNTASEVIYLNEHVWTF